MVVVVLLVVVKMMETGGMGLDWVWVWGYDLFNIRRCVQVRFGVVYVMWCCCVWRGMPCGWDHGVGGEVGVG